MRIITTEKIVIENIKIDMEGDDPLVFANRCCVCSNAKKSYIQVDCNYFDCGVEIIGICKDCLIEALELINTVGK